jgi:hypothetical protein
VVVIDGPFWLAPKPVVNFPVCSASAGPIEEIQTRSQTFGELAAFCISASIGFVAGSMPMCSKVLTLACPCMLDCPARMKTRTGFVAAATGWLAANLSLKLHLENSYSAFKRVVQCGALLSSMPPDLASKHLDPQTQEIWIQCRGFNDKNTYPRKTPCDQDPLRKAAKDVEDSRWQDWFNGHNHPVDYAKLSSQERQTAHRERCYKLVSLLHVRGDCYVYAGLRLLPGNAPWPSSLRLALRCRCPPTRPLATSHHPPNKNHFPNRLSLAAREIPSPVSELQPRSIRCVHLQGYSVTSAVRCVRNRVYERTIASQQVPDVRRGFASQRTARALPEMPAPGRRRAD